MPNSETMTVSTPSDREIRMTRVFDAPRGLVYEAHTSAEHMRHWWGPKGYEVVSADIDFRVGGTWRIVHRGPDGQDYAFHGEYREIVPPERITWTFEFEGAPGQVAVETVTFEERDGKTILEVTSLTPSKEARDAVLESGMTEGAAQTWDRLEEYLESLKAGSA